MENYVRENNMPWLAIGFVRARSLSSEGDARRMAKDVDAALHQIVREQGGKSADSANEYVEKLKTDKRYKRDVY